MDEQTFKLPLTGNPFVDTGFAVIGSLAGLKDPSELNTRHLRSVFADGSRLAELNSNLPTFTQIFGTNNPLKQYQYGDPIPGKKSKKVPSMANIGIYTDTLSAFISEIGKSPLGQRCWSCGTRSSFDFGAICGAVLSAHGKNTNLDKSVGRDWFPLAGSLGSDAQALPCATGYAHICPACLVAIHYLPLGMILVDGKLAVFQSTSTEFWYELVGSIVDEYTRKLIPAGIFETLGKRGKNGLLQQMLGLFDKLHREEHYGAIPHGTALHMWRFSNSGSSPDCQIQEIPNSAIQFLWKATLSVGRSEIESLLSSEGKNSYYSLLHCIIEGRDYLNLYPEGKKKGASPKFFALYQTYVRNHSTTALQAAHELAKQAATQCAPKELKRLQRSESFQEPRTRSLFRAQMAEMVENGNFTIEEYLDLFPRKEGQGISVAGDGWNLIRFYLHHAGTEAKGENLTQRTDKAQLAPVSFCATIIFTHYVRERGEERFRNEVLRQMGHGRIRIQWLKNQFLQLGELYQGFTYEDWVRLTKLDDGRTSAFELLFQMRLLWIQWAREGKTPVALPSEANQGDHALAEKVHIPLKSAFDNYVRARGLERFQKDIMGRLRRKEIGLAWFRKKLISPIQAEIPPLSEEEWEYFLLDDRGENIKWERLFQMHLFLANLYRESGHHDLQEAFK